MTGKMREAGVDLIIQRAASDRNWRPVNRCTCSQINETEHCHRAKTVDKWLWDVWSLVRLGRFQHKVEEICGHFEEIK